MSRIKMGVPGNAFSLNITLERTLSLRTSWKISRQNTLSWIILKKSEKIWKKSMKIHLCKWNFVSFDPIEMKMPGIDVSRRVTPDLGVNSSKAYNRTPLWQKRCYTSKCAQLSKYESDRDESAGKRFFTQFYARKNVITMYFLENGWVEYVKLDSFPKCNKT